MDVDCDLLSVYGSLARRKCDGIHPLLDLAEFVENGWFAGTLFDLGEYPGAVAESDASGRVAVEIYRLLTPEITWPRLDEYEGCDMRQPSNALFLRTMLSINLASGCEMRTWVYLYNKPTVTLQSIKSGEWNSF